LDALVDLLVCRPVGEPTSPSPCTAGDKLLASRLASRRSLSRQALIWETRTATSETSTSRSDSSEWAAASALRPLLGREHELATIGELLAAVRAGGSGALIVRGDPGIGKSALLQQLIASASEVQVVRAAGVEGEIDLPYAGLHQLCRPMTDMISALPQPQREALGVAFGLSSGEAGNRYIVGLAILGLMSEFAATQPLLCVVDDAHWLDPETTRALAFVARRLGADSVALVLASREVIEDFEGVPELHLGGLSKADSLVLLDSVAVGRLDGPVRERFLAETHGNPLALLELPGALTPAEAATGVVRLSGDSLSARIEDGFRRQLAQLPEDTRRLLVLAAAEPLGDPLLLLEAASRLELGVEAADAAEEAGLFQIRELCSFRHPLVRSAVYGAATQRARRLAHGALAEATDPELDPDRRAWHRAQATPAPDEDVAAELDRTAARAKARGGLSAAGAFLERAALLTPEARRRAERSLAAAEVMYEAGAFDSVENLLRALKSVQLDELQDARTERLHAQVSLALGREEKDAIPRLLGAAQRLGSLDPELGNAAHLEALRAAFAYPDPDVLSAVADALDRSSQSGSGAIVEMMLRGWSQLLTQGYPSGIQLLREAMIALREKPQLEESDLPLLHFSEGIAESLWDFDSWESLTRRAVQLARDVGALTNLPPALVMWAEVKVAAGEFPPAAAALAEAETICEVTRRTPEADAVLLDCLRFEEAEAIRRIELHQGRSGMAMLYWFDYARALVENAAGQYEAALESAQRSCDRHPVGTYTRALVELVEAAARCGQPERADAALEQLVERTQLASTEWALGLEARSAALLEKDTSVAESLYRQAIACLGHARARPDLARAHLLFGEWLRRESRRLDAREQLRTAHGLFSEIGMPGFAGRARRELAASGETARKRTDDTRNDLTAQESQVARLASEGLTNPEIGAKLFLSPRTVEWHLRRVYPKLGIRSRKELRTVLHSI
jgi:DNA-binding CsgD family transcriptional regulator